MARILRVLTAIVVLFLAIVIDLVFGDPSPWKPLKIYHKLHPTVWMGKLTETLRIHLKNSNPRIEKVNGVLLALIVITAFVAPVYFGLEFVDVFLGVAFYIIIAAVILKSTICIKLETGGARAVAKALSAGDLEEAKKYHHFSRRDPTNLTSSQIASAVIESMVENLTDFKHSPIIYYSLFGVSGAVAFKAINTLDGVVGFKDQEHVNIGWFSANLDTIVNYIPARLTTILIIIAAAIIGENYKNAWRIAKRDRKKIASRNHGWQMAAIAGALHVQLEKPDNYVVGDKIEELDANKILTALKIRNISIILSILVILPLLFIARLFFFPF